MEVCLLWFVDSDGSYTVEGVFKDEESAKKYVTNKSGFIQGSYTTEVWEVE